MKTFFEAIDDLFVNVLFAPLDMFRFAESWWGSNIINCFFAIIGFTAFIYWMLQLKSHHTNGEEDKSVSAHTYL